MLKNVFKKTEVKKNLAISVIGTALGQLIHLGTIPIISRLYTPEAFGQFSLFMSIFGILTAFSLMRIESAIMVADENEVGMLNRSLKILGLIITAITFIITLVLYFINSEHLSIFIFLSIIIYISNRFWTQRAIVNREKNFKALSLSKILENFINSVLSIGIAFTSLKDIGLYASKILSLLVGYVILKKSTKNSYPKLDQSVKKSISKYKNFPIYSFPEDLVGHLNSSTLIFIFSYLFSAFEVGLIGLTARALSAPANFISVSFYDVFKQKAVEDYKNYGSFEHIFKKFFIILFGLAVSMSIIIGLSGPTLFDFILGSKWKNAGIYAQYLTLLYSIKLMTVPLTFSLEIRNLHFINLIFQTTNLVLGLLIIPIVYFITKNDVECIKYYSLTLSLVSSIQIYIAYGASKAKLPSYLKKRL